MSTQPNSLKEQANTKDPGNLVQAASKDGELKAQDLQNSTSQNQDDSSSINSNQIDHSQKTSQSPNQASSFKDKVSSQDRHRSFDRVASRSPTLIVKHRNLVESSYDCSSRNDEESIMESKSFDLKKRSQEASNSQKTISKHAKISESHHDIKIELEAHSQSSQDAVDTEIKEESTSGQKEATQEFLKSSQSPAKTSQSNSELEGIKQLKEDSDQADTPSSENVINQSPLKSILHISEKHQNSHSSESNLSTPESKTGTRIIEDQIMNDEKSSGNNLQNGAISYSQADIRNQQKSIQDIQEPEDEEQTLTQGDEQKKDEEFEQDENLSGLKDDSRQEFYYENFQQNNIRFEDVEINDVDEGQQQWCGDQNYSNEFTKQGTEKFRAKLYQLDGDGRWNDLGTGYFSIDPIPDQNLYKMTLQQEHDSTVDLLENEVIQPHIQFHRQRETIITWTDKQRDQDLAVSFQNNSGAWQTWQRICQILGTDPDHNSQDSVVEEFDNFTVIARETILNMAEELKNVNMMEPQAKFDIAEKFLDNDQLNLIKLGELFDDIEAESYKNNKEIVDEHLLCFFYIYKGLISLNDNRLLETLLSNKFFMQTFGALEWDPDALQPSLIDPLILGQQESLEESNEEPNYKEQLLSMGQAQTSGEGEIDLVEYFEIDQQKSQTDQKEGSSLVEQKDEQNIQMKKLDENDENIASKIDDKISGLYDRSNPKTAQIDTNNESSDKNDQENMPQEESQIIINRTSQILEGQYGHHGGPSQNLLEVAKTLGVARIRSKKEMSMKLWKDQIVSTKQKSHGENKSIQITSEEQQVEQHEERQEVQEALDGFIKGSQLLEEDVAQEQPESAIVQSRVSEGSQQQVVSEQISEQIVIEQKSCLNYREFLSKIVKFKKIIDFNQEPLRQSQLENTQGQGQDNDMELQGSDKFDFEKENQPTDEPENGGYAGTKPTIEERIHINYRLQYLKDTVMARYIDEQASNIINTLIMANNKEIVSYIFAQPKSMYSTEKSMKDQIIDKIRDKSDLNTRQQAIEFMIELCQILKNLQCSPGGLGGGGASSFIYGSGNNSSNINSRQIYEQLNSANFIGLLAETFSIFVPSQESFEAHNDPNETSMKQRLYDIYKDQSQQTLKENEKDTQELEQLEPLSSDEKVQESFSQMTRLDQMKINSMEIIISFQQSIHVPNSSINKYITGSDQCSNQYPFLKQLVSHLIYSTDQGIKVQICDFFKGIFDLDQNQHNSMITKDTLYNHILLGFLSFIQKVNKDESIRNLSESEDPKNKSHEYSLYLILQIINKVVAEHRFTLRQWMCQNFAIPKIAKLSKLKSKLVNIEIIKFYKSIMRNHDPVFIAEITKKNLFYPINEIFVATYDAKNPPMIQSCIRELYEMILGKNSDKGDNDFPIPKLALYLTRDDELSKQIIFNQDYREVFAKFHLNDGFSIDFVIDNKTKPLISSGGSEECCEDPVPFRPTDGSFYQNQQYSKNKRKYRGSKLNFQQNLDEEDCFIDYNNLTEEERLIGDYNNLDGNEILECEENGFDNILQRENYLEKQKQQPNKKQININNYDESEEKVEDLALSPLASKSQKWNNNFQENLFEELDKEKATKQNKETSEYLFNYDLQEDEEDQKTPNPPNTSAVSLQQEKLSEDTGSNPNSQREVEFDVVFKNKNKKQSWQSSGYDVFTLKNQEQEHNTKAFDKIVNEKKSQSLIEEQQQFKDSLQKTRRQNSGEGSNFVNKINMKKDNSLKLELFDSFENISKDMDKYSSPKHSPRATLTENQSVNQSAKSSIYSNKAQESKLSKQFTHKSLDKMSNNSSDYHFGDDDLAKDMGIFGASQGTDLKKKTSNASQSSMNAMKHKIQGHGPINQIRKYSPSSKSSSQSAVHQTSHNVMKEQPVSLRRKSFDDQENIGMKQSVKLNSADKSDNVLSRRDEKISIMELKKSDGRQSADKNMYLSQAAKNIECTEFPYKSGSQSPVPAKTDDLDSNRPVLGIKRRIDPTNGTIIDEKNSDEVKEELSGNGINGESIGKQNKANKKQKVES